MTARFVNQSQPGTKVIHVRCQPDFHDTLHRTAAEYNISTSDFVRLSVAKSIDEGLFRERTRTRGAKNDYGPAT